MYLLFCFLGRLLGRLFGHRCHFVATTAIMFAALAIPAMACDVSCNAQVLAVPQVQLVQQVAVPVQTYSVPIQTFHAVQAVPSCSHQLAAIAVSQAHRVQAVKTVQRRGLGGRTVAKTVIRS